jgi:hypothetical protein
MPVTPGGFILPNAEAPLIDICIVNVGSKVILNVHLIASS